jgi:exo-1,4-beta-D-glucosaminidase
MQQLYVRFTLLQRLILLVLLCPAWVFAQRGTVIPEQIPLHDGWYVQRSGSAGTDGSMLSKPGQNRNGWYRASVPSTVMGVLSANGLYTDIFTGDNYKNIDPLPFKEAWWFCREFSLALPGHGEHITLNFDGLNYHADIWLNGKLLASHDSIFGPFRRFSFDVTGILQKNNCLAVSLTKARPGDFNLGFVDWNPRPPDENMGIWRGVYLALTGPVSLTDTYVESDFDTKQPDQAWLSIRTTLKNHSPKAIKGKLEGKIGELHFSYPVTLGPEADSVLTLTAGQVSALKIKNPRLWWCNGLGTPELYSLDLKFVSGKSCSAAETVSFGIRKIEMYTNVWGHKGFKLNGREILIKGAGWTDDIFLRDSLQSLETQVKYAREMNLNTLRFETIWGTGQDIYDLCDRYGMLAMVGWSCQWEWEEYLGKVCGEFGGIETPEEKQLALSSFGDQVRWLRNHPSVMVWMVGSDKCPDPDLEKQYAELFRTLDNRPYLASAGTRVSSYSGPTGVKMNGPYEYVAPNYWYTDTINGGAFGFNTETGPGPQVPVRESLEKMIPADHLWPPDKIWDYHCTHSIQAFNTMNVFNTALYSRYGQPANLDSYLLRSDAQSYEAMRAMFEAFRTRIPKSTGIVQWMLNSAWPSLYWHLYDYYLRPTAAYYAVQNANRPLQLIYDYGDNSVYSVNETRSDIQGMNAVIVATDLQSGLLFRKECPVNTLSNRSEKLTGLIPFSRNAFLSLTLLDAEGKRVSGNFYWLSSKPDEFAWEKTYWAYTPMKSYADFTALAELPAAGVKAVAEQITDGHVTTFRVKLSNQSNHLAFFMRLSLNDSSGKSLCPVYWDDNYVSLMPGEERVINCRVDSALAGESSPDILLEGWNTAKTHLTIINSGSSR